MPDSFANQAGLSGGGAMREKYWHERDRDEKLEALRDNLVQLFAAIQGCQETAQALLQHQHSASGQLMTPMDGRERPFGYSKRYIPTSLNNDPPREATEQRAMGASHVR